MSAWAEFQKWLIMNVGSKEAEQAEEIVGRVMADAINEAIQALRVIANSGKDNADVAKAALTKIGLKP